MTKVKFNLFKQSLLKKEGSFTKKDLKLMEKDALSNFDSIDREYDREIIRLEKENVSLNKRIAEGDLEAIQDVLINNKKINDMEDFKEELGKFKTEFFEVEVEKEEE